MAAPISSRDWTAQAADTIETVVVTVKDKTTVPLRTVARAIVYGLVLAALGAVLTVALVAGLIRLADVYLLGWAGRTTDGQLRLYIPYLVVGMVLTLGGLACWTRRTAKEDRR